MLPRSVPPLNSALPLEALSQFVDSMTGLCVKALDRTVLYQNASCISRCGDLKTTRCRKGCMKGYHAKQGGVLLQGIKKTSLKDFGGIGFEVIVVNDGSRLVTLQCPVERKVQGALNALQRFGLTKTETNIIELRLRKFSNAKIAQKFFISKCTLKTHLNNIYRKIPLQFKQMIMGKKLKSSA